VTVLNREEDFKRFYDVYRLRKPVAYRLPETYLVTTSTKLRPRPKKRRCRRSNPVLLGMSRPHAASFLARPISHFQTFCLSEEEQRLYEYCESGTLFFHPLSPSNNPWIVIDKYCKSRTLYGDARYNSLLRTIPPNPPRAFMAAIFCLTCLYVGRPEQDYFQEVITSLRESVRNGVPDSEIALVASIIRLLIQYHIVKRDLDESWVFHIKGFRALQCKILEHAEARSISVRITYEGILKFAPMLQDSEGPNGGLSIDYLMALENPREIRDYGCSPEVLHLLGCINTADYETSKDLSRRVEIAYSLLARCENIDQTTAEIGESREAIKMTAESYVHMARVLIHWRLLNCGTSVVEAGNVLARCVLRIPAEGELFTAQYPLASAFWAILFSPEYGQKCYDFLNSIWTDRPTVGLSVQFRRSAVAKPDQNITHALRVAHLARGKSLTSIVDVNRLRDVMESLQMKELSLS
jgi:hypothetical protein